LDGLQRIRGLGNPVEKARRSGWTHTRQELEDSKAGNTIARVLCPTQKRQDILKMCTASKNFSPPNFTKGMLRRFSSISSGAL
jgi:hypothetical protein